jgi:hypothetical protein
VLKLIKLIKLIKPASITSLAWLVSYYKAAWLETTIKLQANQAKRLIRLACWEVCCTEAAQYKEIFKEI